MGASSPWQVVEQYRSSWQAPGQAVMGGLLQRVQTTCWDCWVWVWGWVEGSILGGWGWLEMEVFCDDLSEEINVGLMLILGKLCCLARHVLS